MRPSPTHALVLFATACSSSDITDAVDAAPPCEVPMGEPAEVETPPLHTPRWAFEPWISKDISSDADTREFVRGFQERDIPLGVVVIDSPWETHYNTFEPNPDRYPEFHRLVDDLHADEIRIVMWMTQMVNENGFDLEASGDDYEGPSPNFQEASDCGYFINGGNTYLWWKGIGAGIDFFNPDALRWWHAQQRPLLDLGIDGWKLDFGEQYLPIADVATARGAVSHQEYSEEYYRDFWAYGVSQRGADDFLTMVRPYDESYGFEGRFYARPEHAPVGWVGDNRRDWVGLADALDHIFRSAVAGYVVIGSDIGGYLDRDDVDIMQQIPFSQETFVRWTAVSALMPFFQLHGRANLAPWTVAENRQATVDIYRYWATLHHELVPFFYSLAEETYRGSGEVIVRPVGEEEDWPGDYRFTAGEAFLVAPILDDTGMRDVELPEGARYLDWWNIGAAPLEGGQVLEAVELPQSQIPLYLVEGAIVPAEVDSPLTGLGGDGSQDKDTWIVYPAEDAHRFDRHDRNGEKVTLTAKLDDQGASIVLSRRPRPSILRVHVEEAATATVRLGDEALAAAASLDELLGGEAGIFAQGARTLWIAVPEGESAGELRIDVP